MFDIFFLSTQHSIFLLKKITLTSIDKTTVGHIVINLKKKEQYVKNVHRQKYLSSTFVSYGMFISTYLPVYSRRLVIR